MLLNVLKNKELHDKTDYAQYILSHEWKLKVEKIKAQRGNRCQLCGASGIITLLDGHHNTYQRLGNEKDEDITILCRECHTHFHRGDNKPGRIPIIDEKVFSCILRDYGITFETDQNPYINYERGKVIIQNIIDGYNQEAYDYYNKINIHILETALKNQLKGENHGDG